MERSNRESARAANAQRGGSIGGRLARRGARWVLCIVLAPIGLLTGLQSAILVVRAADTSTPVHILVALLWIGISIGLLTIALRALLPALSFTRCGGFALAGFALCAAAGAALAYMTPLVAATVPGLAAAVLVALAAAGAARGILKRRTAFKS